jgi:hypothetical protein
LNFFHSSSDSSNDELFEFGVAYDTSVGRQFDEYIRKQRNAKQGTNFGRIRQKLFQNRAANQDEDSNDFDKIVITRKNPSRSIRNQPSPTVVPAQAKAGSSTSSSSSFAMPRMPLVRKFLNSGQAVARQVQQQLVRKSIPAGARVTIDGLGMAVSTPKSNHPPKIPFDNSVNLSPIKRLSNISNQAGTSRPKELQVKKLQRLSQQPAASVGPIHVVSPRKQQPPRDHQLSLTDEEGPEPVDDDVVVMSSSHSSLEIDRVDQSMSIHDPPAKARSSQSLNRMSLRKSSPQKNVTHHSNVQHGASPSPAKINRLVSSLVDDWPDEESARAVQQEEPVKPRQVSFHRTVTVIPAEEEPEEVVESPQHHRSRIQRRKTIHEDESRPVSKKRAVASKAPAKNRSSHYDTVEYETPDSDGTDTESMSKKQLRSLDVIEEELAQIHQEHVPSQEPEPESAAEPEPEPPRPQSNGSSNDSVYYDTQKSPESEEQGRKVTSLPPNPPKRKTLNRPSWSIPPESPMSDGSLLMTNDCENVRQSILSQDTGRDKDEDVFVVPSQSMVVKKRGRSKKSQVSS